MRCLPRRRLVAGSGGSRHSSLSFVIQSLDGTLFSLVLFHKITAWNVVAVYTFKMAAVLL